MCDSTCSTCTDDRDLDFEFFYDNIGTCVKPSINTDMIQTFPKTFEQIEDRGTHTQLRGHLIKH